MHGIARRGAALCAVFAALLISGAATAADEAAVLQARAARLASEGQCAEALPILREARRLQPDAADSALFEGQCLFQANRYAEAVPPLADAARLDPDSGEAALLLGMASYHAGDVAGASAALERAERQLPDRPEVSSIAVCCCSKATPRRPPAASRAPPLGAARSSRPPPITRLLHAPAPASERKPSACCGGFRSWLRAASGRSAPRRRFALRTRSSACVAGRCSISASTTTAMWCCGADDVALPADVSNQGDGLVWWGIEAGHELFRRDGWGGGVLGNYYGNAHFSENDFDQQWLGARSVLGRSHARRTHAAARPAGVRSGLLRLRRLRALLRRARRAAARLGRSGPGDLLRPLRLQRLPLPDPGRSGARLDAQSGREQRARRLRPLLRDRPGHRRARRPLLPLLRGRGVRVRFLGRRGLGRRRAQAALGADSRRSGQRRLRPLRQPVDVPGARRPATTARTSSAWRRWLCRARFSSTPR